MHVGALGGRWGLPGPAAEEMRKAGVGRVRAAGAVNRRLLRIKEVHDDAQDFRMQLAQQAIDFRSEPPHCQWHLAPARACPESALVASKNTLRFSPHQPDIRRRTGGAAPPQQQPSHARPSRALAAQVRAPP